jgi:glucose/arabinose dehydrogenase
MKPRSYNLLTASLALGLIVAITALVVNRLPVNMPLGNMALPYGIQFSDAARLGHRLTLPKGFKLNIYATQLGKARLMVMTSRGDILLSVPAQGALKLIGRDVDNDGRADRVKTLVSGLDKPHGLLLHEGYLYIAEYGRVIRYQFDQDTAIISPKAQIVVQGVSVKKNIPGGQPCCASSLTDHN